MGRTKELLTELRSCTCAQGWCNQYCWNIAEQLKNEWNETQSENVFEN